MMGCTENSEGTAEEDINTLGSQAELWECLHECVCVCVYSCMCAHRANQGKTACIKNPRILSEQLDLRKK